jgi:hypothetical protein
MLFIQCSNAVKWYQTITNQHNEKRSFTSWSTALLASSAVHAGIYIKYYNKDSKTHKMEVKTCGTKKTAEFRSSTSGVVTIQSGCDDAVIYTSCSEVKVSDGDKVSIKDGCITID